MFSIFWARVSPAAPGGSAELLYGWPPPCNTYDLVVYPAMPIAAALPESWRGWATDLCKRYNGGFGESSFGSWVDTCVGGDGRTHWALVIR